MAATPVAPTPITALPTAPARTMAPATYVTTADAFVAALPEFGTDQNALATNVYNNAVSAFDSAGEALADASEASASALLAENAATASAASANYVGAWSSLTGAKTAGISVDHLGAMWLLNANTSDVTADVPGTSAKWSRMFGAGQIFERATNIKMVAEDSGKIIKITSGTFDQTFDPAATLRSNWYAYFWNAGTGIVTFNPDSSELIDGAATKILRKDCIVMVMCTGTAFSTIEMALPVSDQHVIVTTGNGHGSTNTKIRRFTTTLSSAGSAITYADSSTGGGSFTINEAGLYEIAYTDGTTGSNVRTGLGLSLNSAELTTNIESVTAANRVGMVVAYNPSGGGGTVGLANLTVTSRFAAADVVRAHSGLTSLPNNTDAAYTRLSIRKVGP